MIKNIITLVYLVVCFSTSHAQYYPTKDGWERRSPKSLGIQSQWIDSAIHVGQTYENSVDKDLRVAILKAFSREPYMEIKGPTKPRGGPAGLIIKDGYIIGEWGDIERVDMTFSVAKSYLSTIAGLAIDQSLIPSVDDPVHKLVWDGTFSGEHNSKISWRHLLTQSSDWSGQQFGLYDWADRPPKQGSIDDWRSRELHEPGTHFKYNDVRVNILASSLLKVWRTSLPKVLKEKIMDPIGASPTWRWYGYDDSFITIDGYNIQSVSGGGHFGGGIFINTLDHARFGLLFARKGKWQDQQLISENWVDSVQEPSKAFASYGFMWWNNSERRWSELPERLYYAAGFGGNYIIVDEKEDLVIVCRWIDNNKIETLLKYVYRSLN